MTTCLAGGLARRWAHIKYLVDATMRRLERADDTWLRAEVAHWRLNAVISDFAVLFDGAREGVLFNLSTVFFPNHRPGTWWLFSNKR